MARLGPPGASEGPLLALRQLVCFLLGTAVLLDAVVAQTAPLVQWLAGLVLVGILPVDGTVAAVLRARHDSHRKELEELRKLGAGGSSKQ